MRYQGNPRKWCSEACRLRSKWANDPEYRAARAASAAARHHATYVPASHLLVCAICDSAFAAGRCDVRYCSNKCKYRAAYLGRRGRRANAPRGSYSLRDITTRDGWGCSICGDGVDRTLVYPDPLCASVDHVVPLSRGGEDTLANVALAHLVCNQRKGARTTV